MKSRILRKVSASFSLLLLVNAILAPALFGETTDAGQPGNQAKSSTETSMDSAGTRRTMLNWHQIAGLATWALWLATNEYGEGTLRTMPAFAKNFKEEDAGTLVFLTLQSPTFFQNTFLPYFFSQQSALAKYEHRKSTHAGLARATVGAYALTATLALFAPSRFGVTENRGFDSMFIHKALAVVHFVAMMRLAYLGTRVDHDGYAAVKQMRDTGWAGFGVFSVSIGVFYF